jgi:hypothetical protein
MSLILLAIFITQSVILIQDLHTRLKKTKTTQHHRTKNRIVTVIILLALLLPTADATTNTTCTQLKIENKVNSLHLMHFIWNDKHRCVPLPSNLNIYNVTSLAVHLADGPATNWTTIPQCSLIQEGFELCGSGAN